MKITVLAVGKIREDFYTEAVAEYSKRLRRYCSLEIIEVADEKIPDGAGKTEQKMIMEREGERLAKHIRSDAYVIALEIGGTMLSSEGLAEKIDSLGAAGKSCIQFIIGGSLGLSESVLEQADYCLSFSRMTFPHQLMRVILLEQIYRSYKIIRHEPYHR